VGEENIGEWTRTRPWTLALDSQAFGDILNYDGGYVQRHRNRSLPKKRLVRVSR
jgi:hypothetical protein